MTRPWSATPRPRPTRARRGPSDPRFLVLGDIMDGFRPVGAFEPYKDAYFGWVASQGLQAAGEPRGHLAARGPHAGGRAGQRRHARGPRALPKELSDTAWFTERGLTYLKSRAGKPWFLHLGYYRPHPPFIAPAPYHAMYRPEDMPKLVRAASAAEEAKQHPLLGYYVNNINQSSFFQDGKGLGSEMTEEQVAQMRATYCGLMSEVDDQLGRVFDYLKETGQWDDTLIVFTCDHGEQLGDHHLLGKIGYTDEILPHPDDHPRPARRGQRHARLASSSASPRRSTPCRPSSTGSGCRSRASATAARCSPSAKAEPPADWRTEVHYEFDFRDLYYSKPESALGVPMDKCALAVVQDEAFKYVHFAALPPLLLRPRRRTPASSSTARPIPAYAAKLAEYSPKMLDWRLRLRRPHADRLSRHAERTRSASGLVIRGPRARVASLRARTFPLRS